MRTELLLLLGPVEAVVQFIGVVAEAADTQPLLLLAQVNERVQEFTHEG
jgi:hypothetical protein